MDDAFAPFVPPSVAARHPDAPAALLSGAVLARHAGALTGPVLEMGFERAAALAGFLRACRQADAVAVVAVDPLRRHKPPHARADLLDAVLQTAASVGFTGPLVAVARALSEQQLLAGATEAGWVTALARDIEAGFTSMAVPAAAFHDVAALQRVAATVTELGLGIELELGIGHDGPLLLAAAEELRVPLSAVRGASPFDELGSAVAVVDVEELPLFDPAPQALRVVVDTALARDLQAHAEGSIDNDALEGRAWTVTTRLLNNLRARRTAQSLLEALDAARVA